MTTFYRGMEVILEDDKGCATSKRHDRFILLSALQGSSDKGDPTWAVFRMKDRFETNLKQRRFKPTGRLFKIEGEYPNRTFTLVPPENFTNRYDGWVNMETAEAAMVFFNDRSRLEYVAGKLIHATRISVQQASLMIRNITVNDINGDPDNICIRSILEQWARDKYEQEQISYDRYGAILCDIAVVFVYKEPSLEDQVRDIAEHLRNAADSFEAVGIKLHQEIEKEIPNIMKLETKHFVNGVELAAMSTDQRVKLIQDTENHIANLKSVKTKSKMVEAEIAKAEKFLADAIKLFDGE